MVPLWICMYQLWNSVHKILPFSLSITWRSWIHFWVIYQKTEKSDEGYLSIDIYQESFGKYFTVDASCQPLKNSNCSVRIVCVCIPKLMRKLCHLRFLVSDCTMNIDHLYLHIIPWKFITGTMIQRIKYPVNKG